MPEPRRGLDHGAWIPLSLMFPRADVPAVQVSIGSERSPEQHYALGPRFAPVARRRRPDLGLRRRHPQSRSVRTRARPQRRKRAARVDRSVQRVDGRRHRRAALRRSISLCRARALRGAESPDARAFSAAVRDARRGSTTRSPACASTRATIAGCCRSMLMRSVSPQPPRARSACAPRRTGAAVLH